MFLVTGMRLLPETAANDVMSAVEDILDNVELNPFWHSDRTTRILSGEEEGAFAWITANYLNGYFHHPGTQS